MLFYPVILQIIITSRPWYLGPSGRCAAAKRSSLSFCLFFKCYLHFLHYFFEVHFGSTCLQVGWCDACRMQVITVFLTENAASKVWMLHPKNPTNCLFSILENCHKSLKQSKSEVLSTFQVIFLPNFQISNSALGSKAVFRLPNTKLIFSRVVKRKFSPKLKKKLPYNCLYQ